jgi:hypothetical protein
MTTLRTTISVAVIAAALLAGCASQYIISTNDGAMIQAKGKPKLNSKTGMYEYTDMSGNSVAIKQEQVKSILER